MGIRFVEGYGTCAEVWEVWGFWVDCSGGLQVGEGDCVGGGRLLSRGGALPAPHNMVHCPPTATAVAIRVVVACCWQRPSAVGAALDLVSAHGTSLDTGLHPQVSLDLS